MYMHGEEECVARNNGQHNRNERYRHIQSACHANNNSRRREGEVRQRERLEYTREDGEREWSHVCLCV